MFSTTTEGRWLPPSSPAAASVSMCCLLSAVPKNTHRIVTFHAHTSNAILFSSTGATTLSSSAISCVSKIAATTVPTTPILLLLVHDSHGCHRVCVRERGHDAREPRRVRHCILYLSVRVIVVHVSSIDWWRFGKQRMLLLLLPPLF